MNNARRKQLANWVKEFNVIVARLNDNITPDILKDIYELQNKLQNILDDEEWAFDNMPEGFKNSYNGWVSENAIDLMGESIELLDDIIDGKNTSEICKNILNNINFIG